jgi:outer membrane protein OmpA-like peptidoglycan-associated protein
MAAQRAELEPAVPQRRAFETLKKGEALRITFDSSLLFRSNASTLSDTARYILRQLAGTLNRYPETDLKIICHTDNTGQAELNRTLSERRARSVREWLVSQDVASARMTFRGEGDRYPAADNRTPEGRAQNRRVEIWLLAGEQLLREVQK